MQQLVNSSGNVAVEHPEDAVHASPEAMPSTGLEVVKCLLEKLHENDIRYCHWKSNEHVGAGMNGLTDLDMLFDRKQGVELERVLAEVGFKRFIAPPLKRYSGIEDYLGFDSATGRLVHLHLHYELTIGEQHLKGYHAPWEEEVLASRCFDSEHGIYVADPAIELVLLLVRRALKRRWRDSLLKLVWRRKTSGQGDFEREYAFLRERVDKTAIINAAQRLLGPKFCEHLGELVDQPKSLEKFRLFAIDVRAALRLHRTYGRVGAAVRSWTRESQWLLDGLSRRYLHHATPRRRISPRGGAVIILLGSDGAGKSTQSKMITDWLGKKLDVMPLYMGSGDGPSAIYRLPLRWGQRLLQKNKPSDSDPVEFGSETPGVSRGISRMTLIKGRVRNSARPIWALVLAQEKRGKIRQVVRARNRGMVVVCDRFPQSDVMGFNDGPLLSHWTQHPWQLCRSLAAWEAKPYLIAAKTSPDLVLRLIIEPEAARLRRPEMSVEELGRRLAAVRSMQFAGATAVVDIDTKMPIEDVSMAIKNYIWAKL